MWDAEKWSYRDGMKAFYIIMLLLSREPKTQLAGVTMIGDYSGMSRKHMATNLDDIKAWANLISVSFCYSNRIAVDPMLVKYGSEEMGSSLCRCSILLGFIMSKNLRGL